MSRNDRYRPSQLRKLVTPEVRAEAQRREQERAELEHARRNGPFTTSITRMSPAAARRASSISTGFECNHGVPWTVCTICSKPRGVP